ncbi:hypothetical protein QBC44DRAFT_372395 [Cladorrhinum sp. PSN332]|nr:hypothetical protein QBC44DRAFT_372395 [Cladorrhinum sp. PSN332]
MKEACFDMQIRLLECFSSSVKRIHDVDEGGPDFGTPIQYIERRYATANQELGEAVARVERLIDIGLVSRPQFPQAQRSNDAVSKCLMLPHARLTRFFDRVDAFDDPDRVLGPIPTTRESSFRSVALYGLGGVGKSSVALTYTEARYKDNTYDICIWVWGEKTASLRQNEERHSLLGVISYLMPDEIHQEVLTVKDDFSTDDFSTDDFSTDDAYDGLISISWR